MARLRPAHPSAPPVPPILVLAAGAALTGFAPILVRLATDAGAGAEAVAFWRFAFALPVIAVWAALWGRAPAEAGVGGAARGTDYRLLILAGLFFAGDLATWHAGIVRTGVANATFLPNLSPIFVGVGAWLLLGERIGGRFVAGAAAALTGAILLTGAGVQTVEAAGRADRALGDALSALTALWYAAYLLTVKAARARASAGALMVWVAAVGACVLLVVTLAAGQDLILPNARAWLFAAALGVVAHTGGQGAIAWALGRLPAALSAIVILIQPVVAVLLAWLLFGEALGALQIGGAMLVLAGVWIVTRARDAARR